jgi:hypothetical protein
MQVSKKDVLKYLPPFKSANVLIKKNQHVNDIVNGVIETHDLYFKDYDNIVDFFDARDVEKIAANLFNFLKTNVPYKIESEHFQTLRSPAAILSLPADCKSYALFIGGVIDAINRMGGGIDFVYRFASYDAKSKIPEHVFIVLFPNTKNEIWVDPVLNYLDERKNPYFYTDKKSNDMALYAVSGINKNAVGSINLNSVGEFFSGLFAGGKPNPNDWQGWDKMDRAPNGASAAYWTLTDGDSIQNEYINVTNWIAAHKPNGYETMRATAKITHGISADAFDKAFVEKALRAGATDSKGSANFNDLFNEIFGLFGGGGVDAGGGDFGGRDNDFNSGGGVNVPQTGSSPILPLAIGAAVLYFILK